MGVGTGVLFILIHRATCMFAKKETRPARVDPGGALTTCAICDIYTYRPALCLLPSDYLHMTEVCP
jgi:hypothetical protein